MIDRNGTLERRTVGRKAKPKLTRKRVKDHVRLALTLGLGTGIPLLSLGLSNVAGTLTSTGHYALGLVAGGLTGAVLTVSLPHLAWAVRDITGTDRRASWALAIAVDLALVLCELVHVASVDSLAVVSTAIMVTVCLSLNRRGRQSRSDTALDASKAMSALLDSNNGEKND